MQIKQTDFRRATPTSDKKYSKVRIRLMSKCQSLCEQKQAHIWIDPWYAHDGSKLSGVLDKFDWDTSYDGMFIDDAYNIQY
jgi:hypothetical protein